MNTKLLLALVVVLVVVGGGFFLMKKSPTPPSVMKGETDLIVSGAPTKDKEEDASESSVKDTKDTKDAKEFTIKASNFSFSLKEIKVKKGDTVKIDFENEEGTHNWVLDEFNAKTDPIGAGEDATVQFTADKSGTFEYYCSVGNHRQRGMVGKLIVE